MLESYPVSVLPLLQEPRVLVRQDHLVHHTPAPPPGCYELEPSQHSHFTSHHRQYDQNRTFV